MPNQQLISYVSEIENYIQQYGVSLEAVEKLRDASDVAINSEKDIEYGLQISAKAKKYCEELVKNTTGMSMFEVDELCKKQGATIRELEVWWQILKLEAPHLLDSYLLYLEKKRECKDKFYLPRRKCLLKIGLIQALQDIEDDKLDILSISLIPGGGKTTVEKFFTTFVIGRHLDDFNLFFSHSGDITRMYYDGILDITTNTDEYTWNEIFPKAILQSTNAKAEQLNFGKYKPFPSIQCTSVGSKNAGKVRANRYLLCDDMIGGIEEALNKNILDKLWNIYAVDAKQRKLDGCKEIHIATRWSVHDIIGRLQEIYRDNPRARFIAVPDIDPVTGESNFSYDINGFSVEFFNEQQLIMDDVSYRCLYKNEPIEREGLLYHDEELRKYCSLPDREPDAIIGVCDTKTTGVDYMVLPVFYQYGNDFYLVDCICDNSSDFGVQQERLSNIIVNHKMQQCEFESNAGGSRLAHEINKLVETKGGRCNITTKATETNKETRIIVNSDWIKKHCLFKERGDYAPKSDYATFMDFMLSYSVAGKNKHDDVVDCLANFALYVTKKNRVRTTVIMQSPF